MSHKTHQKARNPRYTAPVKNHTEFERRIEASNLILNRLSAHPEHKIKMLYELEKLKYTLTFIDLMYKVTTTARI